MDCRRAFGAALHRGAGRRAEALPKFVGPAPIDPEPEPEPDPVPKPKKYESRPIGEGG